MQFHTAHREALYLGVTHEKLPIGNGIAVVPSGIYGVIFMVVARSNAYSISMAMSLLHAGLASVSISFQTMRALAISIHVLLQAKISIGIRTTRIFMHA